MRYCALLMAALASFFGVALAATHAQVIQITSSTPSIVFQLPSNASTGFRWFLSQKPVWIQSMSSRYIPPKNNRVGAGGVSEWHFRWPADKCLVPTQASIDMLYARSWVPASANMKREKITVYCRPS